MHRRSRQLSLLVVLVLAASAWSQTVHYTVPSASVREGFSAYHQALDNAADLALANVVREAAMSSQIAETATNTTASPNAQVLRRFAEQYWNGNDEAVRRAVVRVMQLRPVLAPILHEQNIPEEVVALVLVESAGNAVALSPKGARGVWQFMPDTARRYTLAVTADRDERLEVVKATRAAARYLRDLYQRFGDLQLVIAAYNAGEQTVERAMARTGHLDYSRINRAPEETRNYVPAVMNAMQLLSSNNREILPVVKAQGSPTRSVLYAPFTAHTP